MKKAFTLAEVLITLGIIGVVAALTIPTLLSNYKKLSTVTQIKHAYSLLSQALELSKVQYGDPSEWRFDTYQTDYNDEEQQLKGNEGIDAVIQNHIMPYVKGAEYHANINLRDYGYNTDMINMPNGSPAIAGNKRMSMIVLPNGVNVICSAGTASKTNSSTGQKETRITGINMLVDINGRKAPNISGRDCFVFRIRFDKNPKIETWQQHIYRADGSSYVKSTEMSTMLSQCATYGTPCSAIIQQNGWTIPDNYPFKF